MEQDADNSFVSLVTTLPIPAATVLRHLDPESRLALFRSSRACRQCALEAADQLTVTLLAHSGLSEAEWQRRRASAEQALAVRGPQRNTKLLLRLPTPNPAALQSILSMSEAAGRAVTELEVVQLPSSPLRTEGIYTPWLQALPAAFPNLHTLSVSHLCGCLPPPAQMPHLRELHVHLCPGSGTPSEPSEASTVVYQCASIAEYLPQLTALSVRRYYDRDGMLLLAKTPALTHLECDWPLTQLSDEHADNTWQVKEMVVLYEVLGIAKLPRSPEPVRLFPPPQNPNEISLLSEVVGPEGLAADDAHHIAHQLWSFAIPPVVRLCLPEHLEPDDLQTAIEIALRQLSILPEGSVIKLVGLEDDWEITAGPAAAAIAAAAPDLPHLTVVPPELPGDAESMYWILGHEPGLTTALTTDIQIQFSLARCTRPMLKQLRERLKDWTLVMGCHSSVRITAPEGRKALAPAKQAALLQRILRTLATAHWRVEPRVEPCIQLGGWTLTQEAVSELACLPVFTGPSVLKLVACSWVGDPTTYQQLPSIVPPCYAKYEISRTWQVGNHRSGDVTMQNFTGPQIAAICRGAEGRMCEGVCEKLQLLVEYHTCEPDTAYDISEADRSLVVACVDEERLGRWVKEVNWRAWQYPSHVEPLLMW